MFVTLVNVTSFTEKEKNKYIICLSLLPLIITIIINKNILGVVISVVVVVVVVVIVYFMFVYTVF